MCRLAFTISTLKPLIRSKKTVFLSFYVVRKQKPLGKGASELENKRRCVLLLAHEEFLLIISVKKKKKYILRGTSSPTPGFFSLVTDFNLYPEAIVISSYLENTNAFISN